MDVISPWLVGRYGNQEEFENYFKVVAMPDIQLTPSRSQVLFLCFLALVDRSEEIMNMT